MKKNQHKAIKHMVQDVIANSSNTAFRRLTKEAQDKHLSVQETVRRRLSNLLRSYELRIHSR